TWSILAMLRRRHDSSPRVMSPMNWSESAEIPSANPRQRACCFLQHAPPGMISRYYLADHVYAAHFENGAVVLNLRTGRYLALGDPGARVLRSLTQEGIDCCALPANFADRCIQQGLLQTRPSDPSPFDPKGVCVAAPLSDIKPSPQQVRI